MKLFTPSRYCRDVPSVKCRFLACFAQAVCAFAFGVLLLLGTTSCEDKPYNLSIKPKIENGLSNDNSPQKIIFLNKNTFKIVRRDGSRSTLFLNQGIERLLQIYGYLGSNNDLVHVLEKHRDLLSRDFADDIAVTEALTEFRAIKLHYPKAEGFANFINALTLTSKNAVLLEQSAQNQKIPVSKPLKQDDSADAETDEPVMSIGLLWSIFVAILAIIGYFMTYNFIEKDKTLAQALAESKKKEDEKLKLQSEQKLKKDPETIEHQEVKLELQSLEGEHKWIELATTTPISHIVETAYFPISVAKDFFYAVGKSSVPIKGHSFYIFTINPDSKTAKFELWNNADAIKQLLKKGPSYLESFCEPLNTPDIQTNNIVTVEAGHAELQGNKWLVKTKTVFKYVSETTPSVNEPMVVKIEMETATQASTSEIAYFSLPMNERIFNNAARSPTPLMGATFYIFKIAPDGLTATFDFWNNPDAVQRAIDKAHSHIDAACDILNDRDLKATHIITEESGFAELKNGKWLVKTKAKIRYLT